MPLLSVITPTQAHNADWLGDAAASVLGEPLPPGWELEWLVQEDGREPAAAGLLPDDARVRFEALGVSLGSAPTRNAALARARGDLVGGLDHDDRYAPGGLGLLVAALRDEPAAHWTCGRTRFLLPEGGAWEQPDVLPPGLVERGAIAAFYGATDSWPFPAAFTLYRRRPLVAAGGWPAAVRSTDAVLLASFSTAHVGIWVDRVVAEYRRWDGQYTVQSGDLAVRDLPHVRGWMRRRFSAQWGR
jgi:glycosyltransferase involved in cell wall biosynthesis